MKKVKILYLLVVLAMLLALCGCGKKAEENVPAEVPGDKAPEAPAVAGGWTLPEDFASNDVPEKAREAFDKAVEGLTGNNLEPLALLGTQVVAGTNYSILCKSTLVTARPVISYKVAVVYADLEGGATLLNIADINIPDLTEQLDAPAPEDLAGGWTLNEGLSRVGLPEGAETAFNKASEGLLGVSYVPVAYLGSQVVAGSNYAVLCKATPATADARAYLTAAVIYADLEGGATFTSFHYINIADFNKK